MLTNQSIIFGMLQAVLLLLLTPLMTGISRQIRAKMHSRKGPGVLRDYYDLIKLLKRQEVSPAGSGFVFRMMPFVLVGTMLVVASTLPILLKGSPVGAAADMITLIYLFAMFRFFFSLSGLDSGSPFAGLGASRELVIGVLVEPILMLALLVAALTAGTTNIGGISASFSQSWGGSAPTATLLAFIACAFAIFIEMGKIPFDYPEAEQELQEGPLTEYSGVAFAMVKLGIGLKQVVVLSLFISIFLPFGSVDGFGLSLIFALVAFLVKLLVLFSLACIFENTLARGRFLLTSRLTWMWFSLAVLAIVFYLTGL